MKQLHIDGRWEDLGSGALRLTVGPYKDVAVVLGVELCTGSSNYTSILLSFPGYEAQLTAEQFCGLYRHRCNEAVLPCDVPGFELSFRWHDVDRSIAELNGQLVQELSSLEQMWRMRLEVRQFRFEGFFLDRIGESIDQVLKENGIDTSFPWPGNRGSASKRGG